MPPERPKNSQFAPFFFFPVNKIRLHDTCELITLYTKEFEKGFFNVSIDNIATGFFFLNSKVYNFFSRFFHVFLRLTFKFKFG